MRSLIGPLAMLFSLLASAQDWALINPAYKYNYSDDGTDTISEQIKVVRQEIGGSDTTYLVFNRTAELCYACWPDCALRIGIPQFFGGSCSVTGDTWTFADPIERVIRSTAQLGEVWSFEPENGTNASLSSIDEVVLLGTLDSIRTMVSDVGDTVIWSKHMGIVRWSMHDSEAQILIGVHGPDVGVRIPTFQEFFPYQPGDLVETQLTTWTTSNSSIWRTYKKYEILEHTVDLSGRLAFTANYSLRQENSTGQFYTLSYGQEIWVLDPADSVLSPVLSSPNELVGLGGPLLNSWSSEYPPMQMVAEHYRNESGHYVIESQPGEDGMIFSSIEPVDTIGCFPTPSSWWVHGHYLIDNELGIRSRYLESYPNHELFVTLGAILSGDTIGTVHGDPFYHVGIRESADRRSTLHPAVASESIALTLNPPRVAAWSIHSVSGQILQQGLTDGSGISRIAVAHLPPGVYMLQLGEEWPVMHRFIVQH